METPELLEPTDRPKEAGIAKRAGRVEVKPPHVLALIGWRRRIHRTCNEKVAKVQVGVASGAWVDVNVDQGGLILDRQQAEAGLLLSLPERSLRWALAIINVATGLDPDAEAAMTVEDRSTHPDDERRAREVDLAGCLVKRCLKRWGDGEDLIDRTTLSVIDRVEATNVSEDGVDAWVTHDQ